MGKTRRRAVMLSGLVLPGLGQWYLGQKGKALAMIAGVMAPLVLMFVRIFLLVHRILMPPGGLPLLPSQDQLTSIHTQAWVDNWWLMAVIVVVWVGSIVDAWREGQRREGAQTDIPISA